MDAIEAVFHRLATLRNDLEEMREVRPETFRAASVALMLVDCIDRVVSEQWVEVGQ